MEPRGIEPRFAECDSAVIPLDHGPVDEPASDCSAGQDGVKVNGPTPFHRVQSDSSGIIARMRRRLLAVLSVLSLLLSVATVVVWARSYRHPQFAYFRHGHRAVSLVPNEGWLQCNVVSYSHGDSPTDFAVSGSDEFAFMTLLYFSDDPLLNDPPSGLYGRPHGLLAGSDEGEFNGFTGAFDPPDYRYWYLRLPCWFVFACTAATPVAHFLGWVRRRVRQRTGLSPPAGTICAPPPFAVPSAVVQ